MGRFTAHRFALLAVTILSGVAAGDESKARFAALAEFASGDYRNAAEIVRVNETRGRVLLKRPLPAFIPSRDTAAATRLVPLRGTPDEVIALQILTQHSAYRVALAIFDEADRAVGGLGPALTKEVQDRIAAESRATWEDPRNVAAEVRDFLDGSLDRDIPSRANKAFLENVLLPYVKMGWSQKNRYDARNRLQQRLQRIWDDELLARTERFAGPPQEKPIVEVARHAVH